MISFDDTIPEAGHPRWSRHWLADLVFNRRLCPPTNSGGKSIRIAVVTHGPTTLPGVFRNSDIYFPIQAGRSVNPAIPDIIGDDTAPSISELNPYLNEMTAIYWLGHHYDEIGNPDFIGFDHYRRFLDWSPKLLKPGVALLTKNAILHPTKQFLGESHGDAAGYTDIFMDEFMREFSDGTYDDIHSFWKTHLYFGCNCFITDRSTFLRYSMFISRCMTVCQKAMTEDRDRLATLSPLERRKYGFIMELVGGYWFWHEQRHGRLKTKGTRLRFYNISNPTNGTSYPARKIK